MALPAVATFLNRVWWHRKSCPQFSAHHNNKIKVVEAFQLRALKRWEDDKMSMHTSEDNVSTNSASESESKWSETSHTSSSSSERDDVIIESDLVSKYSESTDDSYLQTIYRLTITAGTGITGGRFKVGITFLFFRYRLPFLSVPISSSAKCFLHTKS
jgi:hypothetical protein